MVLMAPLPGGFGTITMHVIQRFNFASLLNPLMPLSRGKSRKLKSRSPIGLGVTGSPFSIVYAQAKHQHTITRHPIAPAGPRGAGKRTRSSISMLLTWTTQLYCHRILLIRAPTPRPRRHGPKMRRRGHHPRQLPSNQHPYPSRNHKEDGTEYQNHQSLSTVGSNKSGDDNMD
jgi:hypothetical protein